MRKELDYFHIDSAYGGIQDWFPERMMRLGGCAIVTACDSCIYLQKHKGGTLCPPETEGMNRQAYIRFGERMKPYLRPRWTGINKLELYIDGFGDYLRDIGEDRLTMRPFAGTRPYAEAAEAVRMQIDRGLPVPCLMLHHRDKQFADYDWHWFLLTGYDDTADGMQVKAVTYGSWRWLELAPLWRTGYRQKGGLILYDWKDRGNA